MGITFGSVSNSTSQYGCFNLFTVFFEKFLSYVKPFKVLTFKKHYFCRNNNGVYVLELLKSYDGLTHLYFKEVFFSWIMALSSSIFKTVIIWLGHITYIFRLVNKMFSKFLCHAEHAKPICEALKYYLCTHEENEFLLPAIRDIAEQHVIFHICTYYFVFDVFLIFASS
jgi:hypothetical protein